MGVEGDGDEPARIPVFASVPSKLNEEQQASKRFIYWHLRGLRLEPRTLGGSDHPHVNPLHEVRTLARHCAGGIILGYLQVSASVAVGPGSTEISPYCAPTPWNNLETGVLFGLGLPLMVLREEGIKGGIFDEGASDVLVHKMPMPGSDWRPGQDVDPARVHHFTEAVLRWQALVRAHYYGDHCGTV